MVKKQNRILGLVISMGIAIMAASARILRMDTVDWQTVVVSILYTLLFAVFCGGAHAILLHNTFLRRMLPNKPARAIFSIVLVGMFVFPNDYMFWNFTGTNFPFSEIHGRGKRHLLLIIRGTVISGLFYFIVYYIHILAETQRNILEIEQLKQARLQASLSSLKEQLSPHFLFNTLNTLSSLTQETTVKNFVAELAEVYRYVLQYKEADTATLAQELDFIDSYLYIIKTRLEDAIDIEIQVSSHLLNTAIPPLTLQLLIENAVKHNIASASRVLHIHIYNEGDNNLVVQNNVQPKSSMHSNTGIGLGNVLQRYQLLFNKEIQIEKTDSHFTVKLPIV